jgi:hypothetical protein
MPEGRVVSLFLASSTLHRLERDRSPVVVLTGQGGLGCSPATSPSNRGPAAMSKTLVLTAERATHHIAASTWRNSVVDSAHAFLPEVRLGECERRKVLH